MPKREDFLLFLKTVGKRIKSKRESEGISISELAQKTGINKKYMEKIEEGEAYGLSTTKFFKIAEALIVSPYKLVE